MRRRLFESAIMPAVRRAIPLSARKVLARGVGRSGLPGRCFVSMHLLDDPAHTQAENLQFLWRHHLAFAGSYDTTRFGANSLEASRRTLFDDIQEHLRKRGLTPENDVESVFDAGCSVGHVLRFAETEVFPSATVLRGLDIDKYAIESGTTYLRSVGSKVDIVASDIAELDQVTGDRRYDVVLCCGVLMYLDELTAERVMGVLLAHTRLVLGLICLAHPTIENFRLDRSEVRKLDGARIHNLDALVQHAGGQVALRRWTRPGGPEESVPYFLLAEPGGGAAQPARSLLSNTVSNLDPEGKRQ